MTGIEAHIRVKDDASPVFKRILKPVNEILSKLNAVYTSTGKVSQAVNRVAEAEAMVTKEVTITGKQVAQIYKYSKDIESSELKRKELANNLVKVGNLETKQKQRLSSNITRIVTISKAIALIQAQNVERTRQVAEMEAKVVALRESGEDSAEQIAKIEEHIRTVNAQIAYQEQRILDAKNSQKKLRTEILHLGNADADAQLKRERILLEIERCLAGEEVTLQNILGVIQSAVDLEGKQAAIEASSLAKKQKAAAIEAEAVARKNDYANAVDQVNTMLEEVLVSQTKAVEISDKLTTEEKLRLGYEDQLTNELIKQNGYVNSLSEAQATLNTLTRLGEEETAEGVAARQKVLALGQKLKESVAAQLQIESKLNNVAAEAAAIEAKELEVINKKNAKAAEAVHLMQDEANAVSRVERELEESKIAQQQLAASIDWSNAGQVKQLELCNKITDERANILRYTNQAVRIQTKINTLERQGLGETQKAKALKDAFLHKTHQIGRAQGRILKYEQQSKTAINQNTAAQHKFNNALGIGRERSSSLLNTLKSMMGIYIGYHSVGNIIKTADALTSARARIDLLNKGAYTTEEVMRKIYESAQRSRGSYLEMADVVSKMGMRAPSIFTGGIDEIIAFTETLNKMAVVSGTATTELNSAILQITQALGAGVMRGDEFKSVVENLPVANQAVADYLGKAVDKITELAHDGKITASIFKNGILAAAIEISRKAGTMKWTWGQVWTVFKNTALDAFDSVLGKISAVANSDKFVSFMDVVGHAMYSIADMCARAFDAIVSFGAWLFDNWKTIKPMIFGVSAAFATLFSTLMIGNVVAAIAQKRYKMLQARIAMQAGATLGATVNQWGLNAALAACPTFAFIAAITTLITVIGAITLATIDWDKANIDVGKTIMNVFGKIGSFLREKVLVAFDWVKTKCEEIGNSIIENWSKIAPVVNGVVAVITAFVGVLMLLALWKGIVTVATTLWAGVMAAFTVIKGIATVATTLYALATGKAALAETAAGAATWFANLALIAKIALIVAIIAVLALAISKVLEWCGINVSAIGIICGSFMWLGALIANVFIGIWNIGRGVVEWIEKAWTWCCDNIGTMWDNLGIWWTNLWLDAYAGLCNFVAKALNKLASLASAIQPLADLFDIDLSGIKKTADKFSKASSVLGSKKQEYKKLTEFNPNVNWEDVEYFSLGDAWDKGQKFGDDLTEKINKLGDKVKDFDPSKLGETLGDWVVQKDPSDKAAGQSDLAKALTGGFGDPNLGDIAKNTGDTADNTKSLKDEDAEFLRQIAEKEAINRYTLTDLKVEMNNSNSINSFADIDDVMKKFGHALYKAVKNNVEAALP